MSHAHDHDHDHSHDHGHSNGHRHGHREGPAATAAESDSLVLDIGGNVGALVIYANAALREAEIEISPGDNPESPRSHNQVHARQNRHGISYTAVFPAVPAGSYTVWRHSGEAQGTVTIHGGQVTEHHWD
jgi:hypothetical protein